MLFQPLIEKLAWNLNRQGIILQLHRLDRLEPRLEALQANIVSNDLETTVPNLFVWFTHDRKKAIRVAQNLLRNGLLKFFKVGGFTAGLNRDSLSKY